MKHFITGFCPETKSTCERNCLTLCNILADKVKQQKDNGEFVAVPAKKKPIQDRLQSIHEKLTTKNRKVGQKDINVSQLLKDYEQRDNHRLSSIRYLLNLIKRIREGVPVVGHPSLTMEIEEELLSWDSLVQPDTEENKESEAELMLRDIDKSLYIGEDLKDPEILDFYIRVCYTIKENINEYFSRKPSSL